MAMISRVALLCVWLLVALCGSASAADFGDVVNRVVDGVQGVVKTIEYKAEDVFKRDLNNDGQIGTFRSQEDNADTRQVGGDPRAGGRFQVSRPRTGRALSPKEQAEPKAVAAPNLRK